MTVFYRHTRKGDNMLSKDTLILMRRLLDLQGHIVSFKVETPTSTTGQTEQTPVLLIKEVWKTKDNKICVKGIDVKKVTSPDSIEDAIRNYRLDRIKGHVYDLGLIANSLLAAPPCDINGYVTF